VRSSADGADRGGGKADMDSCKPSFPAFAVAVLIVLAFGVFNISQLFLLKDSYPVSKLWVGADYACIYTATKTLARGETPYDINFTLPAVAEQFVPPSIIYMKRTGPWYTYPPLPALINYPAVYFDLETVSRFVFFLLIVSVCSAYVFITRSFENLNAHETKSMLLAGLMIILLSYPFYFMIVRGHFLGFVVLLLAMGMYFLNKSSRASGVFLGLSIALITFPALILAPLLLFWRYKVIRSTLITLGVLILLCPGLWYDFVTNFLIPRALGGEGYYLISENCSLTNLYFLFNNMISSATGLPRIPGRFCNNLSQATNLLIFVMMAITDFKIYKDRKSRDQGIELALILMYLPLMISVPTISIQYGLVLMILLVPALCALVRALKKPMPGIILWIFIIGISLTQIQAYALQTLFTPVHNLFHFISAFGLFLILIGCVLFKLWYWRTNVSQTVLAT